jgi:diguanylate cyclase (GGDEF)-like protein/PAS domain S-box-containing protein
LRSDRFARRTALVGTFIEMPAVHSPRVWIRKRLHLLAGQTAAVARARLRRLIVALIAGCTWLSAAGAVEKVSVQLNWKHQFEFAAFYAALHQGYYRAAGLDVMVHEGGPGVDAVRRVVEGRADFGVGTSALVVERYNGRPVVALGSLMQHSPIALLALRRNGIDGVHDLAGKPVAVDPHSRDEIDAYLRAAGLQPTQIRLIDQTDWTLASLDGGREAAKVVYTSNEPFFIRGREHEYLLLRPQSAGIDLFGNILFTTQRAVEARPQVVKAFRDATLQGLVYALNHAEEIADLIVATYNTQGKSKEHLLFEADQMRELTRLDIVEAGYMSPDRWRHVVAVLASQNLLPADVDLTGFIYDDRRDSLPRWLAAVFLGTLAGLVLATVIVLRFRQLNRRLTLEVAERNHAEHELRQSEQRMRSVTDALPMRVAYIDAEERYRFNNLAYERAFGIRRDEIYGKTIREVLGEPAYADIEPFVRRALGGEPVTFMREMLAIDTVRYYEATYIPQFDDDGITVLGFLAIVHDVTTAKLEERRLRQLVELDPVTEVANRVGLHERLAQAMEASMQSGAPMAVMYLDLDRFKQVNDTFGHAVGDELLKAFAARLVRTLRGSDVVGRLGGDEFAVVLERLASKQQAAIVADKILAAMREPFFVDRQSLHITTSIGVALYAGEAITPEALLKKADESLYHAKSAGRNTWKAMREAVA